MKTKKKEVLKKVLFFIGISLTFFFIFSYGYTLGLQRKHSYFISNFLPNSLIQEGWETEVLTKTFSIKSDQDNEKVTIVNTVSFPHAWYFEEVGLDDENAGILNAKKYVISSSDENIKLIITPISINNFRSILSTTIETTLRVESDEEIDKRCLGSYNVLNSEEIEYISLYRENISPNKIKYVQEVDSVANPQESNLVLEEFLVFKRDGGFIEGNEFVWIADISLEIDESVSDEEKGIYLKIVDEIVSSLRIK